MKDSFSLDKICMRVVSTADVGAIDADTLFEFSQAGSMISARYAGGKIRLGFLIGKLVADEVTFRYCQIDREGRIDGGLSTCQIERTENGRIRLVEHFQWESRNGSGTNVLEEIATTSEKVEGISD